MDILKDIEKNFLKINIYDKNADNAKLNIIKKQISDYFKYKSDENNIVMLKKQKYDEDYRKARELNNYNYELFRDKKNELHQIFKETKTLASLHDYLYYKNANYADIPDIYTYEHIRFEERKEQVADLPSKIKKKEVVEKEPKKKVVVEKEPKKKEAVEKEPKKKEVIVKVKECPEGKILNPKTNRCIKDVNYKPKPK